MNQAVVKTTDEKFCSECGAVIKQKAEICPKCGLRQMAPPQASPIGLTTSSGRNKFVAAVISLFLGGLGLHKFYLGKTGQGIMYLLFCWTFIPAIIAFVEAIRFLLMSDEAFAKEYGGA
jgi:TM2 domain-containing membrane protein YozV/ribosomal protein L40E